MTETGMEIFLVIDRSSVSEEKMISAVSWTQPKQLFTKEMAPAASCSCQVRLPMIFDPF